MKDNEENPELSMEDNDFFADLNGDIDIATGSKSKTAVSPNPQVWNFHDTSIKMKPKDQYTNFLEFSLLLFDISLFFKHRKGR